MRLGHVEAAPLTGKPVVLVVERDGAYGTGVLRQGWGHASGRTLRILEDVAGLDLSVVETELRIVGANPAPGQFKVLAAQLRCDTESLAAEHRGLISRVSATPVPASWGRPGRGPALRVLARHLEGDEITATSVGWVPHGHRPNERPHRCRSVVLFRSFLSLRCSGRRDFA